MRPCTKRNGTVVAAADTLSVSPPDKGEQGMIGIEAFVP